MYFSSPVKRTYTNALLGLIKPQDLNRGLNILIQLIHSVGKQPCVAPPSLI